jgi:hypothetical protein
VLRSKGPKLWILITYQVFQTGQNGKFMRAAEGKLLILALALSMFSV